MPNIVKIRQCFLKLQLKMSGMFFFETHCSNVLNVSCPGSFTRGCSDVADSGAGAVRYTAAAAADDDDDG